MTETLTRNCECKWPSRAVESDVFPVTFDRKMGEYHLVTKPDGHVIMRFCPWCGGSFSKSKRAFFFTNPRDDEVTELGELLNSIDTCNDMRDVLGSPDRTMSSHPENKQWACQYTYSSKWESLELYVQESADGTLTFSYGGKYRGDAKAENGLEPNS